VIARGWAFVATDYIGLGTKGPHPYLIGEGEARSVLDSVRAARQLPAARLGPRTVVWGHSQGGHAALWTGITAPTYAPDVHVDGIVAIAPAARVIVRATAERCLDIPEVVPSVLTALLSKQAKFPVEPLSGALGRRLAQNTPTHLISAPLMIAQGVADPLVLPNVQGAYVIRRCRAGQRLEYRTYKARDHLSVVARDSRLIGDLLGWTQARFAGRRQVRGCQTMAG
jgi:pimeloyl-ACP methyl ester carboxylesterase